MASESSVADQSINQQAEEKEVGDFSKNVDFEEIIFQPKEAAGKEEADNSKEEGLKGMASTANVSEEKLEPVSDLTKKDLKHEKVGERENSLEEFEVSNSSEPAVEANGGNLNSRADDAHEVSSEAREKSSDFVETSASQEPIISDSKTEDLKDTEIKPLSEDERKPDEAANTESSKDKVYMELIKSEDSKDGIQVLDSAEISAVIVPDASDVPDKIDFDSGNANSIEVPVKDLEVESGSSEEQKSKESTETKEPNSNVSTIDAEREDFGSSSYEVKPSEDAEAVDKKDDGFEVETMQASAKIQEDPEAETKLAQIESDENVFQGVEVKKDDEIVEGDIETSTVLVDVPSLAEISSEEAKASEPGVVVEEETSLESDNIDVLEGDKLVGKEKVVNAEAVQRDLVDTITDPTESEVSSVQVQAPTSTEVVDEALEVTSKEFNIAPEASGVFSEGDKISAGDLKSEYLEGESATSMEAPADITTAEEPLDQVIEEKKIESSVIETPVPSKDKLAEKEDVNDETKEINLLGQADGAHETPSVLRSDVAEKSASQEPAFPESKTEDLKDAVIKATSENDRKSEEAPLVSTGDVTSKDGNFEDETQEAANPEFSKDKVDIELSKLEDSKDELQVLIPAEAPGTVVSPDASETPEKNDIDSNNPTSIEVPVKNLEVDSGSPEEQKSNEKTETKELSSNVSAVEAGGEVVGFPSNETKPSGDSEVIEKNDILEAVEVHEDLEAKPQLAQTQSDENVSVGVEVNRDDEIAERSTETPTVPDDIPLANVSYEEEKASEPGVVVEEEETYLEGNNIDSVPKMADVPFEGRNLLEGDKLVDNSAEAVERDLVDTITDPGEAEVSFVQVKAPSTIEIGNEALEVTSKEIDTPPEASEGLSEGDKLSVGDEKSANLKGEVATSAEALTDISLDPVIEEKIDSPVSERQAPSKDKLVDKEKDVNEEAREINLQSQADGTDDTPGVVSSDFAETSTSQEPVFSASQNEDLEDTEIKPASENERKQEETPLVSTGVDISEENNVMVEAHEATNPEFSKDEVDIKLIESEGSKDEIQVLVPDEIPTVVAPDASEAYKENDVDSSNLISVEASLDPEIESGFLDEKKLKESSETNNRAKPEIHEDLEAMPELAQTQSDENVSVGVEVNRVDDIAQRSIEIPTFPDDIPLANVSYEEKASEPGVVVEEEETSLEGNNIDAVPKMADVSFEGRNVLEGDKLVDNSVEAVERDLVDTITDLGEAEVSFVQVKAPSTIEIVNEALEVTSKEIDTAPEASEVPSEVDKLSAGVEKRENLQGEAATSVEAPKDISLDPVIEVKKIDNPLSERQAPSDDKLVDKEKDLNEEAKEINLQSQADGADETPGVVPSDFAETSTSQETVFSESKNEDSEVTEIKPTSENERKQEETLLVSTGVDISEVNNVMVEVQEAANPEFSKDEVDIKLIESESSKDEIQVLVPDEIPIVVAPDTSEAYKENDVDSSNLISIEGPLDPEIETGFLDEKKLKESTETNEPRHVTAIDAGGEVVGSSSYEVKPSEDTEAVEKKDDDLEAETVQTSVKIQEDLDAKPELGQTHSDENVSQGVEVKNDDEIAEGSMVTSTVPDVPPLVKVLPEEENAAEPSVMVVKEEASLESDNIDTVPVVAEVLSDGLDGDKLVEKGEVVNVEAVERDLTDTFTDPTKAEISSDRVEPLELTSQDLIVALEANEVTAEVDKISAGVEEKSESMIVGKTTSVEAPKDITTVKDSLDQLSEEKNNETLTEDNVADKEKNMNVEDEGRDLINASTDVIAVEVSSEHVNSPEIVEEESDRQALEKSSKELSIAPEVNEVPFVDDKLTAGEEKSESLKGDAGTSVEAPKDISIAEESLGQVIEEEKNESSISDKSVIRERYVNEEAEQSYLVDISTYPIAAEVSSDQVKASGTAEIIKEESNKQSSKVTSNELNIASEASEIPSKGDEVSAGDGEKSVGLESEDATLVEGPKDITTAEESPVQVLEKSECLISEKETPQDNFVDKEKNVKEEAEGRDLVDTSTGPTAAEMSSDQVKASETAEIIKEESNKQAVDETSKELNVASESSEIHSKGDEVSAVDEEKREGLESEDAILVEAPKDIIIAEESPDPVTEKTENSVSEKEALPEDKLVDKEKNVNEEAEERDLVGTSTHSTAAEVYSNQVKSSETAEIVKEESNEQAVDETSKELNVASEATEIPSNHEEVSPVDEEKRESLESEDAILVEAPKDITIAEESLDPVSEKTESSVSEKETLPEDKLVDKEKNLNEEAEKRDLLGTSTHPTAAEVYSNQVKSAQTAEMVKEESNKQAVDETSKELNVASEATEIPSKGDEVSAVDEEKRESLDSEDAILVEAPKDITIAEESLDQVIEKSESSVCEKEALPEDKLVDKEKNVNEGSEERHLVDTSTDSIAGEVYFDQLKAFESAEITEESIKQALEETSKEPNIAFEASDVPSENDKVSASDEEKRESLNGDGDATLMDAPKDIIIAGESLDQVIEKKTEISTSEKQGPPEDKLVDKEKNVNEEAEERVFVEASTDPTAAEVSSDQVKASEIAEIIKEDSNKQASEETSKEFNIDSDAGDVPSKGDEFSAGDETKRECLEGEDATLVVAQKDIIIAEESPDQGIKEKSESSTSGKDELVDNERNVNEEVEERELVDNERNVNEEVEERELVDTSIYPTVAEVSSSQVQASETADILKEARNKQALEISSKELNIASESSDVPTEVDKVSSGELEQNESLKGEVATSSEPPNAIAENKNESSKNETEVHSSKLFPDAVKDIIAPEAVEEKQDENSNDLSVEKKADDSEDKKEEVKITDKSEDEELVAVNAESEKSKDQDPIVSSDSRDVKLTREVSKRESNIFSKVKRTIVKAKKAILRKSPGPKTVSSEAKD